METGIFTFRHAGVMDWERIYRESRRYFKRALGDPDFTEKKYKTKADEIEGIWVFEQSIDAYHRFAFTVEFKVIDLRNFVADGKPMIEGKARWWVVGKLIENYESKTPAGKREIFHAKESWLHKAYKRITFRERDEDLEAIPFNIIDGYFALLRSICGGTVAG